MPPAVRERGTNFAFGVEGTFNQRFFSEVTMFPLIPLLAIAAMLGGGATLLWYDKLSKQEQEEADRIACGYAKELFGKTMKELTRTEANRVAMLTKRHFVN
jgi:hypothetical protein